MPDWHTDTLADTWASPSRRNAKVFFLHNCLRLLAGDKVFFRSKSARREGRTTARQGYSVGQVEKRGPAVYNVLAATVGLHAECTYICPEVYPRVGNRFIRTVLDPVSQVRDVVFVKCIFSSGKPQGVGILE